MRLFDENMEPLDREEIDLTKGHLVRITVIKENAIPIDNIEKFAWDDEDYEEAEMYVLNKDLSNIPDPFGELKKENESLKIQLKALSNQLSLNETLMAQIAKQVYSKK